MKLEFKLNKGKFYFCESRARQDFDFILASFKEYETYTYLVEEEYLLCLNIISHAQPFGWITCVSNTDLLVVGISAHISSKLASEKIPCNIIAAYHHDHIFVPIEYTGKALEILNA